MQKVRSLTDADLGISPPNWRKPTMQEEATIIAALRLWQNIQDGRLVLIQPDGNPAGLDHFEDIATNAGKCDPLDIDGVDTLLSECMGVD